MPFLAAAAPIIAAGAGVASAGVGIAAASGAFNPSAPKSRSEAEEYTKTLRAQISVMPEWLKAEQTYRPKFAQLDADILQQTLPQMLETYRQVAPTLSEIENQTQADKLAAEMQLLDRYGPEVTATIRKASGNDQLLAALNAQAMEELSAGTSLDPAMTNAYQQAVRSAQAGRGMFNVGMPAISAEAALGAQTAEAMRRARQQFAGTVVGLNQATSGDPLMAILGRPSQSFSALSGYGNQAAGMTPNSVFNIQSPYAQDLYNTNYNANASANIRGANMQAAGWASLPSSLNSIASAGSLFG